MELISKEEVYAVVSAAIEVHRIRRLGFLEPVYQEAMEIESTTRQLPFTPQPVLQIRYKKHTLKKVGVLINFGSHPKLEWKRFVC